MTHSTPKLRPSFSLPRRRLLSAALGSFALPFPLLAAGQEVPLTEHFDVVVVGSGLAGLCAAVSAKEAGARSVLVLEKGPLLGGHSIYSSGSIAAVVREKGADGFADTPEQFVADALRVGGGKGNAAILRRIADESEAGLRWLEGMGVMFGRPFVAHSGLKPRSFSMLGNSAGRSYVMAVSRRAVSLGVELRLRARVASLSSGENGWTLGWRKEGEDVERIVELELQQLLARTRQLGYRVEISPEAKRRLATMGYEARYGVRSLKRTLSDNIEEPLSALIVDGRIDEGGKVRIIPSKKGVALRVA